MAKHLIKDLTIDELKTKFYCAALRTDDDDWWHYVITPSIICGLSFNEYEPTLLNISIIFKKFMTYCSNSYCYDTYEEAQQELERLNNEMD